jgi:DNA (cytosine-5)-methyltransferase 1
MNELALFAGAGGGLLGSRLLGWRTVCAVEINPYRQAVLLARQADGFLDPFPIWDDVRTFDGRPWRGIVDVVTAGFPCQPFSVAGQRRGSDDERNGWPDTIRILREVGPRFALLENVPGLLTHEYGRTVFGDLAEAGFDASWCVLGADDAGAPHRRKRLWILAHSARPEQQSGTRRRRIRQSDSSLADAESRARFGQTPGDCGHAAFGRENVAHAESQRCAGASEQPGETTGLAGRCSWWDRDPADDDPAAESYVGRVVDGVAYRLGQLAALGDGQVPAVVVLAWRTLTELHE